MTNEEAIKVLTELREQTIGRVFKNNPKPEALDFAIKALEREEVCHNINGMGTTWHCSVCGAWMVGGGEIYNFCPICGRRVEK